LFQYENVKALIMLASLHVIALFMRKDS